MQTGQTGHTCPDTDRTGVSGADRTGHCLRGSCLSGAAVTRVFVGQELKYSVQNLENLTPFCILILLHNHLFTAALKMAQNGHKDTSFQTIVHYTHS